MEVSGHFFSPVTSPVPDGRSVIQKTLYQLRDNV
jgi:hypothetical protein